MKANLRKVMLKSKDFIALVLKFFKKHYNILFFGILFFFIILGFLFFYKYSYLTLKTPLKLKYKKIFINEKLYNKIKNQINLKQEIFKKRKKEKIPNPFK